MADDEYVDDEVVVEAPAPRRVRFAAVEWNNKTWDAIVLREPTAGQLIEMQKRQDPVQQMLRLIELNARIPPQVALLLPQRVIEEAGKYFESFSAPSPVRTGEG